MILRHARVSRGLSSLIFSLLAVGLVPSAPVPETQDVSANLRALKGKDEEAAQKAMDALLRIGPSSVSRIADFVSRERNCRGRVRAISVLHELDPNNFAIVPAASDTVTRVCALSPRDDWMQRLEAGIFLADSESGLRVLAGLLRHRRTTVRRIAAFVYDETAETMNNLSPAMAGAIREALPTLFQAAHDKDQVVREVTREVIEELAGAPQPDISTEAAALLKKLQKSEGRILVERQR